MKNCPSGISPTVPAKRTLWRSLAPAGVLALLCIAQGAWADNSWPTEYSVRYKSYTSETDNTVEVRYRMGPECIDVGSRDDVTPIDTVKINWCKPTDISWDGQFWGQASVGTDPRPECRSDWKSDGSGGWKYSGFMKTGDPIWIAGPLGSPNDRTCNSWHTYDIPDALAPGLWAIGFNYWVMDLTILHHNKGDHLTNRVFELEDPNAPADEEANVGIGGLPLSQ